MDSYEMIFTDVTEELLRNEKTMTSHVLRHLEEKLKKSKWSGPYNACACDSTVMNSYI